MKNAIYNVRRRAGETLFTCRGKQIGVHRNKKGKQKHGACKELSQDEIKKLYG